MTKKTYFINLLVILSLLFILLSVILVNFADLDISCTKYVIYFSVSFISMSIAIMLLGWTFYLFTSNKDE